MKIYNNLSICALAGLLAFTSCTKEDSMEGSSVAQSFQISVSDMGFQGISDGRAVDENYKTTFVKGDAIGMYGVENGQLVDGISNRKFTLNEKGVWDLDGNPIEYDSERFKNITFYAYYPYQENVAFDPAAEDPFAEFVGNWEIAADQGSTKYTKSDLMTSASKAEDGRLQGKVTFSMQHRMALAVLKMPNLVYDFTNGGLDDYSLNVAPKELFINDVKTTPYYDAASGTYMALVKPEAEYSISGTYQGAKEMSFSAAGGLASGKAKMYTINDANKLDYTLQIGDYLCADGNLVSVDATTVPDNAIGVVCYVGNPQPSVVLPETYSEEQDALKRDYPNCCHGLVIALKNATQDNNTVTFSTERSGYFGTWFESDDEWNGKFVSNLVRESERIPGMLGYNNTILLEMSPSLNNCNNALQYINSYREQVSSPSSSSCWFLPSMTEFDEVAKGLTIINRKIVAVKGLELISGEVGTDGAHKSVNAYWTSNEHATNKELVDKHNITTESAIYGRRNEGSKAGRFRMMLAF